MSLIGLKGSDVINEARLTSAGSEQNELDERFWIKSKICIFLLFQQISNTKLAINRIIYFIIIGNINIVQEVYYPFQRLFESVKCFVSDAG